MAAAMVATPIESTVATRMPAMVAADANAAVVPPREREAVAA